ncbi:RNA-binding S4 domain-containing protein [Azospira restricta]|uniref:RNA-binding S4 domain-containing protein n=1 Tax=Azospira restricta TaxID=404405 RepID=A0A974Y3Y1_9RHOO|nr:RNA-binding S4 domain-containing protein [Azospira restricta]QRJ64145.1 RNA-binding S4 domain-containing protein [Azospira restricta]
MAHHTFLLDGDYIELHIVLKLLAIAPSGGAAKAMIADGLVVVDGEIETRKARKLRGNELVQIGSEAIRVIAAE